MSETPVYAAYPRGEPPYGSPEKLRYIADGYFKLNSAALFIIFLYLIVFLIGSWSGPSLAVIPIAAACLSIVVIGFIAHAAVIPLAIGLGWSELTVKVLTVLLAISSVFCLGIGGFAILQAMAGSELRRYKVRQRFSGYSRKNIWAKIDELERAEPPPIVQQLTDFASPPLQKTRPLSR